MTMPDVWKHMPGHPGYYWVIGPDREPFIAWRHFGLWWRSRQDAMGHGSPMVIELTVLSGRIESPSPDAGQQDAPG